MATQTTSHQVEITRTHNEDRSIPDAIHLRCTCGWTSFAHDEAAVEGIVHEHQASGEAAPPPSTISPD
jgi:hypothetical protein